jgi:phosphatidylinositol dimannoside acyltransferase
VKSRLVDFGYWLGWNALWIMPSRWAYFLFDQAAQILWRREAKAIKQLEMNLSRVLDCEVSDPRIRPLSLRTMRSYMRYYCETFMLPRWTDEQLFGKVRTVDAEQVTDALKTGGVILALPHLANWDWAGAWAARNFGSLCTVAERLRPEGVFQKFLKARTDRGLTLMPLSGDGGTYEFLRDHVNHGRVVALLGDRDVAKSGMTNEFFGHRTSLPIGAALLAIDTGRPLFTCAPWYDGDKLVISFDAEVVFDRIPVQGLDRVRRAQEITKLIVTNFEKHITAHPENWHQLQAVWPDLVAMDASA